jgi:hypothetical protein
MPAPKPPVQGGPELLQDMRIRIIRSVRRSFGAWRLTRAGHRAGPAAVVEAGTEILTACIEMGGTISGEHGIGYEKRATLGLVFGADDLATMGRVRGSFDPRERFNPDKIFPSGAVCGEVRAVRGAQAVAATLDVWV